MKALSKIVEMSPQTCVSEEDTKDYDFVSTLCDFEFFKAAVEHMAQWDNEDVADTYVMDDYDEILYEDNRYILAVCPSAHFGNTGDAYFLLRKDD